MGANAVPWRAPGSGDNVAPGPCWIDTSAASQTLSMQFQFFNSSNVLVTVSGTIGIWDLTTVSSPGSLPFSNFNTVSFNSNMPTSGHTYAMFVNYNTGSSCDHAIGVYTSIGSSTANHALVKVRRSGVWISVGGDKLLMRRGGAWVYLSRQDTCSDGTRTGSLYTRRSGAWARKTSPW